MPVSKTRDVVYEFKAAQITEAPSPAWTDFTSLDGTLSYLPLDAQFAYRITFDAVGYVYGDADSGHSSVQTSLTFRVSRRTDGTIVLPDTVEVTDPGFQIKAIEEAGLGVKLQVRYVSSEASVPSTKVLPAAFVRVQRVRGFTYVVA